MATPKKSPKIDPTLAAQLANLLAQVQCSPSAGPRPTVKVGSKLVPADDPEWGAKVRRYVEVKRLISELESECRGLKEDMTSELERRGGVGATIETLAGDVTLTPGGRNEAAKPARYVSWVSLTWLPPGERAGDK